MSALWIKAACKQGLKIALRHILTIVFVSFVAAFVASGYSFRVLSKESFLARSGQLLKTPILIAFGSDIRRDELQATIDKYKLTPETVEMESPVWMEIKIESLKLLPNPAFGFPRKDICKSLEKLGSMYYVDCATDFIEHKLKGYESIILSIDVVSYIALAIGFLLVITILKLAFEKEEVFNSLELCGASRLQRWIFLVPSLVVMIVISFAVWLGLIYSLSELVRSLFEIDQAHVKSVTTITSEHTLVGLTHAFLIIVLASIFLRTKKLLPLLVILIIAFPLSARPDVSDFLEAQIEVIEFQLRAFNEDLIAFEASFGDKRTLIDQLSNRSEEIQKEISDTRPKLNLVSALVNATPNEPEPEAARLKRFALLSQKAALEKRVKLLDAERDFVEQRILETESGLLQPMRIEQTLFERLSNLQKSYNLFESAMGKVALEPDRAWNPNELGITLEACEGFLPWPVKGDVAMGFEPEKSPPHLGIDIVSTPCAEAKSVYWGTVKFVGTLGTNQSIILEHESGYFTIYSGLEDIYVETGEEIQPYVPIGKLSCDRPQMTFEIHKGKQALNPFEWLSIRVF